MADSNTAGVGHTPTPWALAEMTPARVKAPRGSFSFVADCNSGDEDTEQDAANAAFIVHAVNSHAELLAALKLCAAVVSGQTLHKNALVEALEASRAAIARAEG